jgi:hypothetical protein
MATEIETHASRLLEAMYAAYRAGTDQDAAIDSYLQKAGLNPKQDGFDVVDFLAGQGWVETHHTFGTPRGTITPGGIRSVQELQARRANPRFRAALLRTNLLGWLHQLEEDGEQPNSFQDFVDDLTEDSEPFSEREFRAAATYLHDNGLIEAVHSENFTDGWLGPRLTSKGREYVTDYDGDVAEFVRDQRGGSPTHHSTSVHVGGNHNNFVIDSRDFTQNYNAGINTDDVVKFADLIREMLPVLKVDATAKDDLAQAAADLQTETSTSAPDRGRLQQLVDRLRAGVNGAAETVVKTVLVAAGEAAHKAITGG